jgi:hypothetical protein
VIRAAFLITTPRITGLQQLAGQTQMVVDGDTVSFDIELYSGSDFFDLDENADLMPAINPTTSTQFELDANGDIQPIA